MRLLDKGDEAGLAALFEAEGLDAAGLDLLRPRRGSGGAEAIEAARPSLEGHGLSTEAWMTWPPPWKRWACSHLHRLVGGRPARGTWPGLLHGHGLRSPRARTWRRRPGARWRHHRLLHLFGLEDLDPLRFGLGFDRVLLALERQAEAAGRSEVMPGESGPATRLAVVPFRVPASAVLGLVRDLRRKALVVDLEMKGRAIGKAFGWADGIGASTCWLLVRATWNPVRRTEALGRRRAGCRWT